MTHDQPGVVPVTKADENAAPRDDRAEAVAAEREACAKVAEDVGRRRFTKDMRNLARLIAAAIRARTSQGEADAVAGEWQMKYEVRPDLERPWVFQVWDVSHGPECNHFPIATFDSNGAADDFNERYANAFATVLNRERAERHSQ